MSQQPPENSDSQQPDANSRQQADSSTPQNVVQGNQNRAVQGKDNKAVQGDSNIVSQGNNNTQNIHITNYYYREDILVASVKPAEDASTNEELPCPYRGLFHFSPDDAEYFFGREVFIEELFTATQTRNFIPVLGASGSGKSSVVLAGLVPKLQQEGHWLFTHFRPGSEPFYALAQALVPLYEPEKNVTEQMYQARQLAEYLVNGSVPLKDVFQQIERNYANHRLLLIADQFEELYTLCSNEKIRRSFLDTLLTGFQSESNHFSLPPVLVSTMRADFLGNALAYPPFADVLRNADIKLIRSMNRSELSEVIAKPAQKLRVTFQDGLIERILDDVESEPGNLPLLEFALTKLWEKRTNQQLTHAAYEAIGEVQGALASYADKKYDSLSNIEQEQVRRIFIQLVRPGEGTEDTRRLAIKAELGETSWELVTKLADARLVVTSQNANAQETVEVVHEALILNWGRLRQWMAIDRDFRAWQERLRVAMRQWDTSGRDEGALLRGKPLADAEDWLQKRPADLTVEQEYIQASLLLRNREHKEQERRKQQTIIGLAGGLAGALILASGAFWQWQLAEMSRTNAELNNLSTNSEALFTSNQEFEALIESIRAGRQLQQAFGINADTRMRVILALQESVYGVKERNRFAGSSVSFSPDGKMLALVSSERTIELLNIDGRKVRTIKDGDKSGFSTVSFSPDGKMLASVDDDIDNNIVKLWNIDGTLLKTLKTEKKNGQHVINPKLSFSPNGKMLGLASNDGTVKLWSIDGTLLKIFEGQSDSQGYRTRPYLSFSPDSKMFVVVNYGGKITFWNTNGTLLKTIDPLNDFTGITTAIRNRNGTLYKDFTDVSFSPDGKKIALVNFDTVELIALDGRNIKTLKADLTAGTSQGSVSFSPDGKLLAAATGGNSVKLWNLENGESKTFMGFSSSNIDVTFSADGKTLATASGLGDDTVKLWSVDGKKPTTIKEGVSFFDISPDVKMIATSSYSSMVKLWSRNGILLKNLKGHTKYNVTALSFSPNGRLLASASNDGTVKLWTIDGTLLKTFNNNPVLKAYFGDIDLSFSPDSKILASANDDDDTIKLWSIDGREIKTFKENNHNVTSVSFNPDGKILASAGGNTVQIWSREGILLKTFDLKSAGVIQRVRFSPDGRTIALASSENTVKILDTNGRELKIFKGHNDRISSVNFNPDGKSIVSASADGTVKFWSINGRELKTIEADSVSLSRDGKTLALGSTADGTVILKSLDLDELLNLGCDWLHDYLKNSSQVSESDKHLCDASVRN